jgi:LemA protein
MPVLIGFLVLLAIILIPIFWAIGAYNGLVKLRNLFKNAFSQIDVQLKRRHDLIPNLVETAKGYLTHERETLDAVISARNQAQSASKLAADNPANMLAMKNMMGAESGLSGALGRLMAVVEAYPELKANQTMSQLTEELTSTENKISFARQHYNDTVMQYNTQREVFPTVIIANMFGFSEAALFEITDETEKAVPEVSFG